MKNTPKGWPRLSVSLVYQDAAAAIDWLCRAFDFEVRLKIVGDGGRIEHSELTFGEAVVMIGQEDSGSSRPGRASFRSPKTLGGVVTGSLMIYVDDADAHCARARAAGATIFMEPDLHDYGPDHWADRSYGVVDIEGHYWWFTQRVRDPQS